MRRQQHERERRLKMVPLDAHFPESQLGAMSPVDCEHFKTESEYAHGAGYALERSSRHTGKRLDGRLRHSPDSSGYITT